MFKKQNTKSQKKNKRLAKKNKNKEFRNTDKQTQKAPPGTIKKVLNFIGKKKLLLVFSVIFTVLSVALMLYIPLAFGYAIDCIAGAGAVNFDGIKAQLIKSAVAIVLCAAFSWALGAVNNRLTFGIIKDIRQKAFDRINILPLSYLDSHPSGNTLSRIIGDVDTFADGLLLGFTQFLSGVLTIAGTFILLFTLSPVVAIVVAGLTPVSLFVAKYIASHSYRFFRQQAEDKAELTEITDETVASLKTVRAFNMEQSKAIEYNEQNSQLGKTSLSAVFYSSLTNPCTRFVNAIVYAAVAFAGAASIMSGGALTVGLLASALSYANKYTKPFNEISSVFAELQNALCCAARVIELIEAPSETPDSENSVELVAAEGNIRFDNLCFSYSKDVELIKNLCLDVKKGERVAIVGPTGCGKTTLINLLMRFYDADSGTILLDGTSIYDISRSSMRSNYGMVLQETWLKAGTVKQNIAFGKPNATDEEIINAAKLSHAHSFIKRLKNGYDTVLGEDGGSLSQGQKQLLCIARVMLCSPGVLILDEATSSIDTVTEQRVQKAFKKLTEGRTSFVVAHRLSTVMNADVILVMNSGKVVEQGTHSELLQKNGFYAKLWNSR